MSLEISRKQYVSFFLACGLVVGLGNPARGADSDVNAILKLMPADMAIAAVIVNGDQFDKNLTTFIKSVAPTSDFKGITAQLKSELGAGEWIDFSKPFGLAQATIAGGNNNAIWARSLGFAEKVKALPNAKEVDGVWHLTFEGKDDMFCVAKGDLIIAGTNKDILQKAMKVDRSLADELKGRIDILKDRDFLFHLNFEPIRPMALGGIQQAGMMAPMLAGMLGDQSGLDPTGMTTAIAGFVDGVKKFVEQASYLELVGGMGTTTADVTLAFGFKDGEIRNYLEKRKPASAPLLAGVPEQPYMLAMGVHFPGNDSPFMDWLFDKVGALGGAPAADGKPAAADGKPAAASAQSFKEALKPTQELYRKLEGWNMVMNFSPNGMQFMGDYIGSNPKEIHDLAKKSLVTSASLGKAMGGGAAYEPSGSKKIGEAEVDEFAIKFDTSSPQGAQAAKMFGNSDRFFIGVVGDRVRYFLGVETEAAKAFRAKIDKPLASAPPVAEAVKALPAKKNVLMLIDLSNIMGTVGMMMGKPPTVAAAPTPPAAISLTLSGDPARLDIHIPLGSLRSVIQAAQSGPM